MLLACIYVYVEMPSIHINDDVFADYVVAENGDASAAKERMQETVAENAPEQVEA